MHIFSEPVNDKKRVVAILPYTRMPDTDELRLPLSLNIYDVLKQIILLFMFIDFSFQKGDIFFVHNDMGDGWLWVTAHKVSTKVFIRNDIILHKLNYYLY